VSERCYRNVCRKLTSLAFGYWRKIFIKPFNEDYPSEDWDEVSENRSFDHYFLYEEGVAEAYRSIELGLRVILYVNLWLLKIYMHVG